jgi:hypothetical protein
VCVCVCVCGNPKAAHDDAVDGLKIGTDAELEFLAVTLPVTLQRIRKVRQIVSRRKKVKQHSGGAESL